MRVLRSRNVERKNQTKSLPENAEERSEIVPSTPVKAAESIKKIPTDETLSSVQLVQNSDSVILRRSARLSLKYNSAEVVENVGSRRKRKGGSVENGDEELVDLGGNKRGVSDGVRRKARVSRGEEKVSEENGLESDLGIEEHDAEEKVSAEKVNRKRRLSADVELLGSGLVGGDVVRSRCLNLRSGKKIAKPGFQGGDDANPVCEDEKKQGTEMDCVTVLDSVSEGLLVLDVEDGARLNGYGCDKARRSLIKEDENKAIPVEVEGINHVESAPETKTETAIGEEMEINPGSDHLNGTSPRTTNLLSQEEKGKVNVGWVGSSSNHSGMADPCLESALQSPVGSTVYVTMSMEAIRRKSVAMDHKERFKNIARKNASRFAHFSAQDEEVDPPVDYAETHVDDAETQLPQEEANMDAEDWPGPFSTALKIIRDRALPRQRNSTLDETHSDAVVWVPKKNQKCDRLMKVAPSLQEKCMPILADNVDAITSLESVPDALRNKLTQLLCDCRKINSHFLDLLASGSPSEIRVRDSSWLTEEQFTKTFESSDISKLTVLQLDLCGQCLPDYVLFTTLASSPNKLSALTTLSLNGACRLSDSGLNALVTSAPALKSINLRCCSLLTSDGINNLAYKLASFLRELYIDECTNVDAMRILPALLTVEHLEVLSILDSETVCDDFIKRLVAVRGQKMKELILGRCMKLTDSSLKAIAESCPGLCAIDLSELCKLTDSAIGYLAKCRAIQTMKLHRNAFSDEAVAAYLEACGEPLKELSLNHVDKVGHATAVSLSKRSRNLLRLDLSWCRRMTNEALGLIVDSCSSLKVLRLFGCSQITNVFTDGHSNQHVKVIGLDSCQILKDIEAPDLLPLRYSSA